MPGTIRNFLADLFGVITLFAMIFVMAYVFPF
jgi:hypothetical protein